MSRPKSPDVHPRLVPRIAALIGLAMLLAAGFLLVGCRSEPPRSFTLLSINDLYRIEGTGGGAEGGLSRVRALRAELENEHPDLLFFHAGDLLFPSLMSRQYDGEQMIDVLNLLDGDAEAFDERMFLTFGNHEFDQDKPEDAALVDARIEESQFRWLDTNIVWTEEADGSPAVTAENLTASVLIESGGVMVGIFSLTTDFKVPAYVAELADTIAVAREQTAALREDGAEFVVALTHLRLEEDEALLETLGAEGPDLVLGGHEHERNAVNVGGRYVLKADADGRSATVVRVTLPGDASPEVAYEHRDLLAAAPTDPVVDARVDDWLDRLDRDYCGDLGKETGCLEEVVGRAAVNLDAEELEIRLVETNLGNWVADQALAAFADEGARIAFVNSGGLRLNRDLPPGEITLADIEEIFQYARGLVLLRIPGSVLQEVIDHAVTDWRGHGKWLQIAGFAFRHDPSTKTADRLTLLTSDGPRPVDPDEELLAVTVDFLANPGTGQDGYTMLTREMWVSDEEAMPELRQLVLDALAAAGEEGIAPEVEGRICNTQIEGPCRAIEAGGQGR